MTEKGQQPPPGYSSQPPPPAYGGPPPQVAYAAPPPAAPLGAPGAPYGAPAAPGYQNPGFGGQVQYANHAGNSFKIFA